MKHSFIKLHQVFLKFSREINIRAEGADSFDFLPAYFFVSSEIAVACISHRAILSFVDLSDRIAHHFIKGRRRRWYVRCFALENVSSTYVPRARRGTALTSDYGNRDYTYGT